MELESELVEQANHGELLILLGTELYRRDHGIGPPTPKALVGPYLKCLHADFIGKRVFDTTPVSQRT
jgi:hypothetical protein